MRQKLTSAIQAAVKELFDQDVAVTLSRPEPQFGDYTTNVALQLAAQVGQSPREVADRLASALKQHLGPELQEVNVAGPGFLNFMLSDAALVSSLDITLAPSLTGKKIVTEYSDPNPFKPLHAGHLYTTIVGDVIARLLEQAGAEVIRINYGGDVGLHVGKTMWAIDEQTHGDPAALDAIPPDEQAAWLGDCYVRGNAAYEDNEVARAAIIAANKQVYEIQASNDHESAFARMYWTCRTWSYDYLDRFYEQLAVHPFDRFIPESEIVPLGLSTVREQLEKGVYEQSDGAVVFRGEAFGLHTRVFINSQGLPTYEAKDVGLLLTKWKDYHFDESIIITASEQAAYMKVVLKSVAQFAPEPVERSQHLTHGIVKLKGGIKMSSRLGNVVGALDIIEAATEAQLATIGKPDPGTVLAAIKYAFLKNRIGGDIMYDPAESVSLEGNSGPYLQYAHARARSIVRKAETTVEIATALGQTELQPDERRLVQKISEFDETMTLALQELMPHYICTYLYELAQVFNRFYEHNRVLGDERETVRLALVKHYASTLKQGLSVLGISAPEGM